MITDIPNYDILYNLEYRDRFGFVTLEFRQKRKYFEQILTKKIQTFMSDNAKKNNTTRFSVESTPSDTNSENERSQIERQKTWTEDKDKASDCGGSTDNEKLDKKYWFGKCDKHDHQIDMNDLIIRVLNPGHFVHSEKMNFKFTNYTTMVFEENEKFKLN